MKILMDFDGVFTDPAREGDRCTEIFGEILVQEGGLTPERVLKEIVRARAALRERPFAYGWKSAGRISAFGPEDPLIHGIGIGDVLDEAANTAHSDLQNVKTKLGIQSFLEICNRAFKKMSDELRAGSGPHVDPDAIKTVQSWIRDGHTVRVVSNSDPSKLHTFFQSQGINEQAGFGFRGSAGKFELSSSSTPQFITLGEMKIFVDRPKYREILSQERPDVVIGDGISLDLATPLALSNEGVLTPNLRLFLKKRPYTPEFSLRSAALDSRFQIGVNWSDFSLTS